MPLLQSAKDKAEKDRDLKHGPGEKQDAKASSAPEKHKGDQGGEEHLPKTDHEEHKPIAEAKSTIKLSKGSGPAEKHNTDSEPAQKAKAPAKRHEKKAHTAPPSEPENAPGDDEGESEGGGDGAQPDADSDESESQASPDTSGPNGEAPQAPAQDGGNGDEGDADSAGDQQQGGQQAQGGTPVPNPAAPGAGDDTSGGEDTPPPGQGEGDTGGGETPPTAGGPEDTSDMPQVQMTPALKEEYLALDKALQAALYQTPNDAIAGHVLQVLLPDGPHKLSSAIHICIVLARELFTKNQGPPQLILPFTRDVVAHVLQLGEQVKQIQYSDQELAAIMGGALEGALKAFGVKKSHFDQVRQGVPRSVFAKHARNYTALHAYAAGAVQANKTPQPAAGAGPQGPQGAPPGAPPASPDQSTAPSGPPPAAALPPTGGPLAQGAAASGQGA